MFTKIWEQTYKEPMNVGGPVGHPGYLDVTYTPDGIKPPKTIAHYPVEGRFVDIDYIAIYEVTNEYGIENGYAVLLGNRGKAVEL